MPLLNSAPGAIMGGLRAKRIFRGEQLIIPGRMNHLVDPGFEGAAAPNSYWTALGTALAFDAAEFRSGVRSLRVTGTAVWHSAQHSIATLPALTAGSVVRLSVWIKAPSGAVVRLSAMEYDTTPTLVGQTDQDYTSTGGWQRMTVSRTAATTGNKIRPGYFQRSAGTVAVYLDEAMVEVDPVGPLGDYRDGGSPGWSWTGAPNASTSYGLN